MKLSSSSWISVALLLSVAALAIGQTGSKFTGEVVGITDGDTIDVVRNRASVRVRFNGIDSPERGQAFGTRASQYASELAFRQAVTVEVVDIDRYGRYVGDVYLPDGRMLNRELVRAGFAWWYRQYAPNDKVLEQLEREAREARRGLWANPNPIAPWDFRRGVTTAPVTSPAGSDQCHSAYPTVCIPPPPPDLDCGEITARRFQVVGPDVHRFDGDRDGIGCET